MEFTEHFDAAYAEAEAAFTDTISEVETLQNGFNRYTGGRNRNGAASPNALCSIWMVLYCALSLYAYICNSKFWPLSLAALVVSMLQCIFFLVSSQSFSKYTSQITAVQNDLSRIKSQLTLGKRKLAENKAAFLQARWNQWNMNLSPQESIPQKLDRYASMLSGMQEFRSGRSRLLATACFFASGVLWSVVSGFTMKSLAFRIGSLEIPSDMETTVTYAAIVVSALITLFLQLRSFRRLDAVGLGIPFLGAGFFIVLFILFALASGSLESLFKGLVVVLGLVAVIIFFRRWLS